MSYLIMTIDLEKLTLIQYKNKIKKGKIMKKIYSVLVLLALIHQSANSAKNTTFSPGINKEDLSKAVHTQYMFDQDPGSLIPNLVKIPQGFSYYIKDVGTYIDYKKDGDSLVNQVLGAPNSLDAWFLATEMKEANALVLEPDAQFKGLAPTVTISKHMKGSNELVSAGITLQAKLALGENIPASYGYADLDTIALIKYFAKKYGVGWGFYSRVGYIWRNWPLMAYFNINIDNTSDSMVHVDSVQILVNMAYPPVMIVDAKTLKDQGILREGAGKSRFAQMAQPQGSGS